MYQNDISELKQLTYENIENIFTVYQDENNQYYYNLLNTIQFPDNLPESFFITYTIKYGDTWPLISYKMYGDIKLWWIITLANNIINPTTNLVPSTQLKIPKITLVKEILTQILTQQNG
jgi:hypothetical protein